MTDPEPTPAEIIAELNARVDEHTRLTIDVYNRALSWGRGHPHGPVSPLVTAPGVMHETDLRCPCGWTGTPVAYMTTHHPN